MPGVYEGGLKVWEASIDLVDYLAQAGIGDIVRRASRSDASGGDRRGQGPVALGDENPARESSTSDGGAAGPLQALEVIDSPVSDRAEAWRA